MHGENNHMSEPRLRLVNPVSATDHTPASLEQRLAQRIVAKAAAFLGLDLYTDAAATETPAVQLRRRLEQHGILNEVAPLASFSDEPRLFRYTAKTTVDTAGRTPTYAGGTGRHWSDPATAELVALVEAAERYYLYTYRSGDLKQARYRDLAPHALSPTDALEFSEEQRRHEPIRSVTQFDEESTFSWVSGWSVFDRRSVWLPAQRVFLNYRFPEGEARLTSPSSNGGGAGLTLEQALWGALTELVERDAFFIFWLRRLSPPRLDLNAVPSEKLRRIAACLHRYRLECHVLDITTDLGIPTFATVLRDHSGVGPAVSVAAKAGFQLEHVIAGAIAEALSCRFGARIAMGLWPERYAGIKPTECHDFQRDLPLTDRMLLWAKPEMREAIEFFISGPHGTAPETYWHGALTLAESLKRLLDVLHQHRYAVYYWRTPVPREIGLTVLRAVVPGLVQIYLEERFPLLASPRLKTVPATLGYASSQPNLNPIPHPFQ